MSGGAVRVSVQDIEDMGSRSHSVIKLPGCSWDSQCHLTHCASQDCCGVTRGTMYDKDWHEIVCQHNIFPDIQSQNDTK